MASPVTAAGGPLGASGGQRVDAFISYSHAADGLLAPRLQAGLQRFAKPWWRRRALRVFRDESSLSANPHLWSSITSALDSSEWFVLLLSPEAGSSLWVNREVEYWLANKDPERILPVLTEGEFYWDERVGGLDPARTNVAPPALLAAFSEEPRWVDLRWARDDTDLDLRNSRFRGAVADTASTIRGVPKDDLESEEVRQHRRTVRTAWGAGVALAVLAVAAGGAAVYANDQRQEADTQRLVAEQQTEIALTNEARAEEQTGLAEESAAEAEAARQLARSRELAASAINVLDDDPELSILLALEAIDAVPAGEGQPVESISALREAIHSSPIIRREQVAEGGYVWLALSPDGTRLATAAEVTGVLRVVDTQTWETIWEYSDPDTIDTIDAGSFSPDGKWLFFGYVDSTSVYAGYLPPEGTPTDDGLPSRIVVVDAATGGVAATIEYPECPTSVGVAFSPDGRWLSVATGSDAADGWCNTWWTELIDTQTWTVDRVIPMEEYAFATWSGDGSRLVLSTPGTVYDTESMTVLGGPSETLDGAILSPDGSTVAGIIRQFNGTSIGLFDVATGDPIDRLTDLNFPGQAVEYTPDGSRLIGITGGAETLVWDMSNGKVVHTLPSTGPGAEFAYDAERDLLYHAGHNGQLTVWDLSGAQQGEIQTQMTRNEVVPNTFAVGGDIAAHSEIIESVQYGAAFDPMAGTVLPGRVQMWQSPSLLPDGRLIGTIGRGPRFGPEAERGPIVLWNPRTDDLIEMTGCWILVDEITNSDPGSVPCSDREGTFTFYGKSYVSPDGTTVLVHSPVNQGLTTVGTGEVITYDAATFQELSRSVVDGLAGIGAYGGDWAVVVTEHLMWVRDMDDGTRLLDLGPDSLGASLARLEVGPRGTMLAWTDTTGGFTIADTETWERIMSVPGAHTGRTSGLAFSSDGARLMTSGTDGQVKVWDLATGEETTRIPLDGVSDGHWLDEDHILVATSTGLWTTLTLDVDELVGVAESRLTRDFTSAECTTYRIERCTELP